MSIDGGWDWFITLSAKDYQLVTQDGWKEAIAVDNVRLILSPERETLTCNICVKDSHPEAQTQPLEFLKRSVLGNAENRMTEVGLFGPAAACASKPKFRQKHEKSVMLQYVIVDAAIYLAKRSSYFQT